MTLQRFEEQKAIHLDSLKEYITMLSIVPGSLKTGLTGEEVAMELIKGATLLKNFIETGAIPPRSSGQ